MDPQVEYSERVEELWRRIAQIEAWSRKHWHPNDLEQSTRTPTLRPVLTHDDRPVISAVSVEEVARRRAEALRSEGIITTAKDASAGGHLLAFDPGQSLSDGAAAAESQGFFDDDNTPPWDCWLLFVEETPRTPDRWSAFDSYLLCWVPASLVEVATRAININPEQCLRWADELSTSFLDQIRRTGAQLRKPAGG